MEINPISVILTFSVTAAALFLAGYFALKHRLVWALICLACFLSLFNPTTAFSDELCKPIRYADGDTFNFKGGGELVRVCECVWL